MTEGPVTGDATAGDDLWGKPVAAPTPADKWAASRQDRDSRGRHAAAREPAETLILPASSWWDDPEDEPGPAEPARRPGGRHASAASVPLIPVAGPAKSRHETAAALPDKAPALPDKAAGRAPAAPALSGQETRPADIGPVSQPGMATRPASGPSKLRIVWVYPDLLSTYGDRGNLLVLSRRAGLRGIEVEAVEVNSDQPVPADGDIYLLGGGEDLPQILAARRLRADGGLAAAADRGAVVFAVCAGYQVLGDKFGGVDGEPVEGLGILDISSGRGTRRGVGELVADVDPALSVPRLTGFENHQGVTRLGPRAHPLALLSLGVGNGDGTEGAYAGKVLGTYLHGPALARNPGLADLLLSWVVGGLRPLDPEAEEWASQLRSERLAAVAQSLSKASVAG
jgi:CobQ-like glutamine amidotransferase family enzyme